MVNLWKPTRTTYPGGLFTIVFTKVGKTSRSRDVTFFRDTPTQISSFGDADPFGDATAQMSFPSITPFDDFTSPELAWLGYYSNVDIYWAPAVAANPGAGQPPVIDSLTNTPSYTYAAAGTQLQQIKVFEGYVASFDFSMTGTEASLSVSCQGALFQADRYLQKPFFPPQPWSLERLVRLAFDHDEKPHLRTQPMRTVFPVNWKLKIPKYDRTIGSTRYSPVGKPGTYWSGYGSRQTGSWDHALTGFVQDQLSVMITDERSGVTQGNQWTIRHYRAGEMTPAGKYRNGDAAVSRMSPGRLPILQVRDRHRAPDFTVRVGMPGVTLQLTGDSTQSENVIFGEGTSVDGTEWRNSVVADNGRRTEYLPLAADRAAYPAKDNPSFRPGAFVSEAYTRFGSGFDQDDATRVARQQLQRDQTPGWTGTITLSTDPSAALPRWCIHAGMTVLLKNFAGSGERGMPFHISATSKNPTDGTVELTVDTRYRDLLTVDEAQSRTRDPLTPVKMLQVNRTSVTVEDIQAPWQYGRSGYVPNTARHFYDYLARDARFPYDSWTKKHPPKDQPHWYVTVPAGASHSRARWTQKPVPILTSEKGAISRSEFACYDFYGNRLKIPFHVSIYYSNTVQYDAMPHLHGIWSPYLNDAFEAVSPETGQQNNPLLVVDDSAGLIIGWGNQSGGVMNRAGFWPGRESDGAAPTGLLVDESSWTYDNTHNANYDLNLKPGKREKSNAVMLYAMFYAEYHETVYITGRLYRQNPGSGS